MPFAAARSHEPNPQTEKLLQRRTDKINEILPFFVLETGWPRLYARDMPAVPVPALRLPPDSVERPIRAEWEALVVESIEEGLDADFDPIEETREILSDPVWIEGLEEAERDLQAGDVVAMSEVWRDE